MFRASTLASAATMRSFSARVREAMRGKSPITILRYFCVTNAPGTTTELYRLADLSTAILEETGEFIHAMPYRARSYDERTPLMHEIRAEGVDL